MRLRLRRGSNIRRRVRGLDRLQSRTVSVRDPAYSRAVAEQWAQEGDVVALRWYSVVVDCRDPSKQAQWWAEALGWRLIHDSETECVIIPSWVDEAVVRDTAWERRGPGMVFVPVAEGKSVKNRLHIDLAPHISQDREAEIERLQRLGATRVDVGQPAGVSWTVLIDPEGNEFCMLSSRDM